MPDNCVTGLFSLAILKSLMKNIIAYPRSGLYIIPALSFNDLCSRELDSVMSARVEGIIGGELKDIMFNDSEKDIAGGTYTKPTLMQITWWKTVNQTYYRTAATTITNLRAIDGHPNTYSFMIDCIDINNMFDLAVRNVLSLGIRLNTEMFELYYDSNRRDITNRRNMI